MSAWDQGWQQGSRLIENATERNRQLSDEEREGKSNQLMQGMQLARQKLATLEPNSPEHTQLSSELQQAQGEWNNLFHPSQGPSALQHLGRIVSEKFLGHKPQAPTPDAPRIVPTAGQAAQPATAAPGMVPAVTGTTGMTTSPALPAIQPGVQLTPAKLKGDAFLAKFQQDATPKPQETNPYLLIHQQALAAGASPQDAENAVLQKLGIRAKPVAEKEETWAQYGKPVQVDGKWVQPFKNKQGEIENRPTPGGYAPPAPAASTSALSTQRREYAQAAYGDPNHPLTLTDETNLLRTLKEAQTGTNTTATIRFVPQPDGSIKAVPVTTTSSKNFGAKPLPPGSASASPAAPATTTPTAAQTPAALKSQVAAKRTQTSPAGVVSHGWVKAGETVGGRPTAPQTMADKDVVTATKLDSLATQAEQTKEPGQQKQLALALIKAMAGRVNMQEYGVYTKGYGVENTVDGLIQGIENGGLAPGVLHQLVNDARANLTAAKAAQTASRQPIGGAAGSISDDEFLKKF